jgi:hypothetical protein
MSLDGPPAAPAGAALSCILHDRVVPEDVWEHWLEPEEPIVFVVGAGFSRAVSDQMPLTDQLGVAALGEAASGPASEAGA